MNLQIKKLTAFIMTVFLSVIIQAQSSGSLLEPHSAQQTKQLPSYPSAAISTENIRATHPIVGSMDESTLDNGSIDDRLNTQVNCSGGTANIPPQGTLTINGVTITSSYTGDVQTFDYPFSSCSPAVTTSANGLHVGKGPYLGYTGNSPWKVTLKFNKPVNDLVIVLTATGSEGLYRNENFVFNSNGGTVSITAGANCYSTISGNTIYSGSGATETYGGGGLFKISAPTAYTQLVINGDGSLDGSLLAICGVSIKESCAVENLKPSVRSINNYCPETTVNLNSAHTGTTPSNASLLWYTTSNRVAGTQLTGTGITQAGAGTYYAFYYSSTAGCYSQASNPVTVTIEDCTTSFDLCYDNIIGNDFTWSSVPFTDEWGYFNHHGWGDFENNWSSENLDPAESGSPLQIYRETTLQPGTTGGFVFDIFALDNSFNMEINGTKLAVQELQFQFNTSDQIPGNVQFMDGSYTGSGVPDIWELYGDKASDKPIIRVVIDANGKVTLYGSKASYDDSDYLLEEMKLIDGNTFNTISWNEGQDNEVVISQLRAQTTMIVGYGYGRLEVPCDGDMPCVNPALGGAPNGFTKVGITTQSQQATWPESIPNGFIALESKDKGMVISRVENSDKITDPKEGMLIYDIAAQCVKLYNGTVWNCIKNTCD